MDLNTLLETEKTGKHELSTVANGVDRAVLDNNALVAGEEALERRDDCAEVGLVTVVVVEPLGIKNVVESDQALGLVHSTRPHTAQLLHVRTNTEQKTQVNAEGTDVSTSLAADPENTKLPLIVEFVKLALVNGSDTELALDGGDERGTLEESTSESLEGTRELGLATRKLVVQANNADVFLSSTLLGLDETGSAVNAHNQASSDLRIEGSRVTSLLDAALLLASCLELHCVAPGCVPKHALDPRYDFVGRRVRRLVEVDDTGRDVLLQVTRKRCASLGNGSVVRRADEHCKIVSLAIFPKLHVKAAYSRCSS